MKKKTILIILWIFFFSIFFLDTRERRVKVVKKINGNEGKRWAICIGINNYEDSTILDLKKARNDAKMLGKVLQENGQFDHVYVMTDDLDARKENYPKLMNIKRKLDFLKGFIEPGDLVVFSFSGHGISDPQGEGLLILADSYPENLSTSSIRVKDIVGWLKGMGVKKSLLLLDACREHFQQNKGMNLNGLKAARFQQAEVAATFYATKSGWFSYEDETGDYGVFTKYVIEGLMGSADDTKKDGNGDGLVAFSELASYVEEAVTTWALKHGKKQKPYTKIYGEKYGDLALSAAGSATISVEPDLPPHVKAINNKAKKVYKNSKGFWEAEFDYDIVMVYIPPGEFKMGQTDFEKKWLIDQVGQEIYDKYFNDEKPSHNVYLDGYWIGKHEITVGQVKIFVNDTKYRPGARRRGGAYVYVGEKWQKRSDANWRNPYFEQNDYHPVVCVSWYDANAFCNWISRKAGIIFHLPTEAQWEKAARGTNGTKYPWGHSSPNGRNSNFADMNTSFSWRDKTVDDGYTYTANVGSYPDGVTSYGLFDMAGNVWEWCSDWYDKDYYKNSPFRNPGGPANGSYRVLRGGGWDDAALNLRCADRHYVTPARRCGDLGFRLSMEWRNKREKEMNMIKVGMLVALADVTSKPIVENDKLPVFPKSIRKKYKGTAIKISSILLINENGYVQKVKFMGDTPVDIRVFLERSIAQWKYKPAKVNDVIVKVWLPRVISLTFQ